MPDCGNRLLPTSLPPPDWSFSVRRFQFASWRRSSGHRFRCRINRLRLCLRLRQQPQQPHRLPLLPTHRVGVPAFAAACPSSIVDNDFLSRRINYCRPPPPPSPPVATTKSSPAILPPRFEVLYPMRNPKNYSFFELSGTSAILLKISGCVLARTPCCAGSRASKSSRCRHSVRFGIG